MNKSEREQPKVLVYKISIETTQATGFQEEDENVIVDGRTRDGRRRTKSNMKSSAVSSSMTAELKISRFLKRFFKYVSKTILEEKQF